MNIPVSKSDADALESAGLYSLLIPAYTLGANSTTISQNTNLVFVSINNGAITYATTLSGAIGAGAYRVRIVLELSHLYQR